MDDNIKTTLNEDNAGKNINMDFQYEVLMPYDTQYLLGAGGGGLSEGTKVYEEAHSWDDIVETKFDKSINESDRIDYSIAVASGVITAALDIMWMGEFSLESAHTWGKEEIEKFVIFTANAKTKYKGKDLKNAVEALEKQYKFTGDLLTHDFGDGFHHHLRDFSHHASLLGLGASILTQLTGHVFGTATDGSFICPKLPDTELRGKNFEERIFNGVVTWVFHLISDVAGSSGTIDMGREGTGIPGPLLSTLKAISTIPGIEKIVGEKGKDNPGPSVLIQKMFDGTLFRKKDEHGNGVVGTEVPFDLRTEIGLFHEASRQAVPVIINECIVRSFFFIRRLFTEIKENEVHTIEDLCDLDPQRILPYKNRSLTRMITISSGVFMTIDATEAAVANLVIKKNVGGFFLSLNYVGIGRFVFACRADSKYISEDVREKYKSFLEKHSSQENKTGIPSFSFLCLSGTQTRLLHSLMLNKVVYDIGSDINDKQIANKIAWKNEWIKGIKETIDINESDYLIEDDETLYDHIQYEISNTDSKEWLYLILIELYDFNPYYALGIEQDKDFKKLKYRSKYEENVFCIRQSIVDKNALDNIRKTYKKYANVLNNTTQKTVTGIATTVVVTAATGGLALAFAPQIAVVLAGESVAGLYGAALTSSSLAILGGGSLAAGGLGVAGGTAIIAGGGTLLGAAGSGLSVSAMIMFSSKECAFNECRKLLTFCKCVLADTYNRLDVIAEFVDAITSTINDLENELLLDEKNKKLVKERKASLKYLARCKSQLQKIIQE